MVKFLKPGKVVLVLSGRWAGRKAVILKTSGPTKSRRFDHCLVAGIAQYPRPIKRRMPLHQIKRRSIVRGFASYFNLRHVMPTRYNLDLNLKGIVDPKKMEPGSKNHKVMKHKLRVAFTQRYVTGKNKWFFTKLRF